MRQGSAGSEKRMQEIVIETLMSPEVQCAAPSTPMTEIVRRMRLDRRSCVLITESDRAYRYGGEELLLLLPETNRRGAENLGQKLLKAVARCALPHKGHSAGIVTLSAGIGSFDEHSAAESWEELLQSADRALYRAKNAGRNQIV
jgi:diguanylate cyclase (GGDEF)-like protein